MVYRYALSKNDQNYLAYLRGFAIISIVFGHVGGYWFCKPYSAYLHVSGSTFFFFLSGPILFYNYLKINSLTIFYIRRYLNLLVPYYIICFMSLFYFCMIYGVLPEFNLSKLLRWILVDPSNAMMPFPLGQLWFLHVYIILFLLSPLIFYLYINYRNVLISVFLLSVFSSIVPILNNGKIYVGIIGFNLFEVFYFLSFFLLGIFVFDNNDHKKLKLLLLVSIISYLFSYQSADITNSFLNRDLFALSATFIFIIVLVLFKNRLISLIEKISFIKISLKYFHKHTFSVYLSHSFIILFSEKFLGFDGSNGKTVIYGLSKFFVVLTLTAIIAFVFSFLSKGTIKTFFNRYVN